MFPPHTARYVRLRALTEANGLPYTSVAELDILEKDCTGLIPSVRLLRPRSHYLQSSSTLLVDVDACVEIGQGVRVMIDGGTANGGSQFDVFSPPYTISVPALSQHEHVVEAFVIDAMGIAVSGDATYDYATRVGVGEYHVAVGDGITYGLGDDIPSDDNSLDGRTKRGSGYPSLLSNLLTAAKRYPVTVANEAIQGTSLADLLPSIPTLIDKHPNAQRFLINSGHNDFLVDNAPSGFGLNPGNPGYVGSFKDRLQQIINLLKAAGKEAVLSKAPPALPLNSAVNFAIQQYNMVVDELAANPNNGITVPPPDFYTYFESRTTTHYATNFELNGLGYQEMAQLWLDALTP
jgi:lysophospholipase L1-like esterase